MICPVCEIATVVLEMDNVEVDYCLRCKGVWLDAGELELLLEMAGIESGSLSSVLHGMGGQTPGQKRRCPACGTKMLEVQIEGPARVTVDRCPLAHGLWLDDGELGRLIESAGGSAETAAVGRLLGRLLQTERSRAKGEL